MSLPSLLSVRRSLAVLVSRQPGLLVEHLPRYKKAGLGKGSTKKISSFRGKKRMLGDNLHHVSQKAVTIAVKMLNELGHTSSLEDTESLERLNKNDSATSTICQPVHSQNAKGSDKKGFLTGSGEKSAV
ncbi:hypothetical protein AcV7_004965 [Taiwanofungus camphoratus]|nr:hypothetical protein AcV7_004965 [Antrodia cinnamomea]